MIQLTRFLTLVSLSLTAFSSQAMVTARVSDNPITEADTVTLTITSDQTGARLDLSLLEVNFDVVSRRQSQQTRITGTFQRETLVEWIVRLAPKHTGVLRIPSLKVGNEVTEPIDVQVLPLSAQQQQVVDELFFVEAKLSKDKLYVEENALLHVQFFYQRTANGSWQDIDAIDGVVFERWGDERRYQQRVKGIDYRVIELNYRLKPLQPGQLIIPAFTVAGDYQVSNWGGRRRFKVSSDPITLNVLDIPSNWPSSVPWLPAKSVKLTENWNGTADQVSVGDTLNRSLTLQVDGQDSSARIELTADSTDQFKIYSDEQIEQRANASGPVLQVQQNWAIIPLQPGSATLPEVTLTWWNTEANRLERARLPKRNFQIQPSSNTVYSQAAAPDQPTEAPEPTVQESSDSNSLVWVLSVLVVALTVLWGITLTLLIQTRRQHPKVVEVTEAGLAQQEINQDTLKTFRQACQHNDLSDIRRWLQDAIEAQSGLTFDSLSEAVAACDQPSFELQTKLLDQCLFQPNHQQQEFNGPAFWHLFQQCRFEPVKQASSGYSDILYPTA